MFERRRAAITAQRHTLWEKMLLQDPGWINWTRAEQSACRLYSRVSLTSLMLKTKAS